jgi:hypothetical protein
MAEYLTDDAFDLRVREENSPISDNSIGGVVNNSISWQPTYDFSVKNSRFLNEEVRQFPNAFQVSLLDFTHVDKNPAVKEQGKIVCIHTGDKGYFSPQLQRYPSRQDLAKITHLNTITLSNLGAI